MTDIDKYYQSFMQDVISSQLSSEEGDTQEQTFTRKVLDLLSVNNEVADASVAYDEKALGTRNQHKINGYAIDEDCETINLFISVFINSPNEKQTTPTSEIERAVTRITNFFRKAIYNDYANEIEESSEIFQFAHSVANDEIIQENLRNNLLRIYATILTNGEYKGKPIQSIEICGCKIIYNIVDINYLYQIEQSGVPIEIDFDCLDDKSFSVPCLMANTNTQDYQAYVAIVPGACLTTLYELYNERLLQQNVRSFLQFKGKNSVNVGIRNTIVEKPYMFLAYNNGITATADHIELDETNHFIKKISNLQIVNGGQTTASIYHSWKDKKIKADISNIFVQMKLSVINAKDQFADIVSDISKYANTQNKVNTADFSANNASLKKIKEISRSIIMPKTENGLIKNWFFERVRGEFDNARRRLTPALQRKFDLQYPKEQRITKELLGLYINSFPEIYEGNKLLIGPHTAVKGKDGNYPFFIKYNLPENVKKINNVYYEDAIAKCILFKTAEKRYGTGTQSFKIGEMRKVVVPYTLSLLDIITRDKSKEESGIDLYKIWKNQQISQAFSDLIYDLMKQVNQFILDKFPNVNQSEKAKKQDFWETVRDNIQLKYDLDSIKSDLIDENNPPKRKIIEASNDSEEQNKKEYEISLLQSIPYALWKKIEGWGKDTVFLSTSQQSFAGFDMANAVKFNRAITDINRNKAMRIYEIVCEHNIDLLAEADELAEQPKVEEATITTTDHGVTIELVQKMVAWDKRRHILKDWQWHVMNDIVSGAKPLNDRLAWGCKQNLKTLKQHGFTED
ncbi:hypothetical protein AGMMS49965_07100 [Bacteroidia bacterium]|nr:hypothetical protein AGMMS49965_07100 [Bacteroidia bacterium]